MEICVLILFPNIGLVQVFSRMSHKDKLEVNMTWKEIDKAIKWKELKYKDTRGYELTEQVTDRINIPIVFVGRFLIDISMTKSVEHRGWKAPYFYFTRSPSGSKGEGPYWEPGFIAPITISLTTGKRIASESGGCRFLGGKKALTAYIRKDFEALEKMIINRYKTIRDIFSS